MIRSSSRGAYFLPSFLIKNRSGSGKRSIFFDIISFLIIAAVLVLMSWERSEITGNITTLHTDPITLDYHNLFEYSMRSILRMFIAIICSIIFSIIYATIAAKNRRMEQILIPLLDILQSVPILGYISFTVAFFLGCFPGEIIGAEFAAIFAIFTSQVWNIIFSVYQSFKTIPKELNEVASIFRMTAWQKFWRVELPFAIPGLIWNKVVSMSGGWFFVVVSEVMIVGGKSVVLPGIGSYIALALEKQDSLAIIHAIIAMISVILIYNQLVLNPLIVWADKFHYENTSGSDMVPSSWVISAFRRSKIMKKIFSPIEYLAKKIIYIRLPFLYFENPLANNIIFVAEQKYSLLMQKFIDFIWYGLLLLGALFAGNYLYSFISQQVDLDDIWNIFRLAVITWTRVILLVAIASIIWVPIGIYIGLHPKLGVYVQTFAQFLAAFPLNILFPITVILIVRYDLDPNIWLSPLMIVGTQWYILFNVIAGSSAIPLELRDAARNFRIKGFLWLRKIILPAITPYFITGAITAYGGAWNASIVAEVVNFGDTKLVAKGLGSYINSMTVQGDFPRIALGIGMMVLFVVVFDHIFWQPLYAWSRKRFQI